MNWHHWYWLAAGAAIGVVAVCVRNWIVNEIGYRRTMASLRASRTNGGQQ